MKIVIIINILLSCLIANLSSQEHRWIKVGSLHSWYRDDGCEPEIGRTSSATQQDGLQWPGQYKYQDCQAAKGLWIGTSNYTDAPQYGGNTYPYKVVHCGPRVSNPDNEFMPIEFKLVGRFDHPLVSVDGMSASGLAFGDNLDEIDESLNCDRMIHNEVNTSIGITMTRTIKGWTHQDHDNYFIYQYTFSNTGNVDTDPEIEQFVTLQDVYFFFQYRYAPAKEPFSGSSYWLPQSCMWGHNTMLDARSENPNSGDPFRALFAWHGKHSQWQWSGDNIGGPDYTTDGHLAASQYLGTVVLHADKSANDKSDDPFQPQTTHYLGSDVPITRANSQFDGVKMAEEYEAMIAGHPAMRHADAVGDGYADQFGGTPGGYSHTQGFGPYTLAPGEAINIIIAEGVSGLSREKCYEIGDEWLNGSAPFTLPDGSTTSDRNQYKNAWVFTGHDSLFQTFNNAISNYETEYNLPLPPPPPSKFDVISDKDQIILSWNNTAETDPAFAGYKIFRTTGQYDAEYEEIFACGAGTEHPEIVNEFHDEAVARGFGYFYYIVSFSDGTTNNGKPLYSSLFWTRTSEPAFLRGESWILEDLYVSPEGDDNNSGLSEQEPVKTINKALTNILGTISEPRVINLAPGVYSPSTTGEPFPLSGRYYITVRGADEHTIILSSEDSSGVFDIFDVQDFTIEHLTIMGSTNTYEDEIKTQLAGVTINNVTIRNNQSSAIESRESNLYMNNVTIYDNQGGGIYCNRNPEVKLSNVTVKNNKATGIYFSRCEKMIFDPENRCTVYSNNPDLSISTYIMHVWPVDVFLDTFTVNYPSDYHLSPVAGFNLDFKHIVEQQVAADMYVAPDGDDNNSGLSAQQPLKTIKRAVKKMITNKQNRHTVYLAPGVYSPVTTGETLPVKFRSHLSLIGASVTNTILDAQGRSASLFKSYRNEALEIKNLSVRNVNGANAVYIVASKDLTLSNMAITGNTRVGAFAGPALYINGSYNVQVLNTTIAGNKAVDYQGNPTSVGALWVFASEVSVVNSVLWQNGPEPLFILPPLTQGYGGPIPYLSFAYSTVQYGEDGLYPGYSSEFNWLTGSIDTDPLFRDTLNANYQLRTGSPCINTGVHDTTIVYDDGEKSIVVPKMTFIGSAPDMGAFEFDITDISKSDTPSPLAFALHQNYPNPFNPITNISFDLPKSCNVMIEIYNSLGQKVQTLVNADKTAGQYKIRFNASHLASGVYFYRIETGSFKQIKKMLLIK